jgi:hypothetical protein
MKIGLIDVDHSRFPNIALMKISAWHKSQGDEVEWYTPFEHYNRVYVSKVFSFSEDWREPINADEVIRGGSGYAITIKDGREEYNVAIDNPLSYEIEHIYPDYSIYPELTKDTAYGFLTRGCPRGCEFCIVASKEGRRSYKVADLSEFWNGQKYIKLLDPNILACKEHPDLLKQLIDSKAYVDFNQGVDIRLTNEANIRILNQVKFKEIHFAWDNAKDDLRHYFSEYARLSARKPHGAYGMVYVLVNFNSDMEENLYRIYTLREMGYNPYVMVFDKPNAPKAIRDLQRWCNNKWIFKSCPDFKDYKKGR